MKLYIDENNKVVTIHEATSDMKCFEEFENRKPYSFDGVKELENCIHPIHVLLNTSMIDEKWIYMNLKSYISKNDRVCILAFSFFNDTKNESDWNKQYAPGQGIWYRSNQDVFYKYGIGQEQIVWVNYFKDSMDEMKEKILNSSILMKLIKNYKGIMIGYSAGAMIQLDSYHISPDEDYPEFLYQTGLGCLSGFAIEPHFRRSNVQLQSIEKVKSEKQIPVYGIYEEGGMIIDSSIKCFGKIEKFE